MSGFTGLRKCNCMGRKSQKSYHQSRWVHSREESHSLRLRHGGSAGVGSLGLLLRVGVLPLVRRVTLLLYRQRERLK